MLVEWNKDQLDFQSYWLWQFGAGPFVVLHKYNVPINTNGMQFEPGQWLMLAISAAAHQYRVEYKLRQVMFHSKWLKKIGLWRRAGFAIKNWLAEHELIHVHS